MRTCQTGWTVSVYIRTFNLMLEVSYESSKFNFGNLSIFNDDLDTKKVTWALFWKIILTGIWKIWLNSLWKLEF